MAIINDKIDKLVQLYKILNGTLAAEIPNYFRQKERQTRNYHPLKFVNAGCRTNIYNSCNTEAFKLTVGPRPLNIWAFFYFYITSTNSPSNGKPDLTFFIHFLSLIVYMRRDIVILILNVECI